MVAKAKEGEDFKKLSLIFILTIKPAIIKIASPIEDNNSKIG